MMRSRFSIGGFACLTLWFCVAPLQAGTVTATLKNVGGANAPATGTRFVLSYTPLRQTNGVNPATFSGVTAGTYTLEGYSSSTFWGEEFWASEDVSVLAGQTTSASVTRRYPYASSVVVSNVTSGGVISSGETLPAGTQVRAFVTVTNALASAALNSRVRFIFDISQSEPYGEFDSTTSFQSVAALGRRTFTFDFTPTVAGQNWFAYRVDTTLLNGNTLTTDSAGWQQAFQSLQSLTILGRVAYHSYSGYLASPMNANDGHIFIFTLPNGTLRRLTQGLPIQNAMNPHISNDGSRIVFMAIPQGGALNQNSLEIYCYDLATESLTRLTTNGVPDEDAKFSPDGQTIVFKRNGQVWMMGADGGSPIQLTFTADEKSGPNFSPDGADLIYWSEAGANADVWRMTVAGTGAEKIIGTARLQEYYPIYRDAQNILYTRWESTGDALDKIYSYSTSSTKTHRLAVNHAGANDSDSFPVDSNLIGFSSDRSGGDGGYDVYLGNPATGVVFALPAANNTLHDLGGWYSPYSDARKVVVLNPTNRAQFIGGSTTILRARGYSNGGVWAGASPKIVLLGAVNAEFTGLHDDGMNGDQTAGDGIYSKSVTLPSQVGNYTVYSSAKTTDNGITHEIRSTNVSISLVNLTPPTLSNPRKVGTTFTVSLPTQLGFNYVLEFKNFLTDANWTAIQTNGGTGGPMTLTNTGATTVNRFYRVRVQ
ncbi:MAG: PD40 domain-containing protein [Verrucomicrobiales bacterium]|nr:PD40 domain-containing protein [Verrucomicrobiales bacterium]